MPISTTDSFAILRVDFEWVGSLLDLELALPSPTKYYWDWLLESIAGTDICRNI